jgi:pSer/pThr/pTyr-binding forkhead associated (FHA) protein
MKLDVLHFGEIQFSVEVPADDFLGGSDIFIGRGEDCHIELDDQQISRHHALIELKDNQYFLKKLSNYGSLMQNGNDVTHSPLSLNDRISINNYTLVVTGIDVQQPSEPTLEIDNDTDRTTLIIDEGQESTIIDDNKTTLFDEISNEEPESSIEEETTILDNVDEEPIAEDEFDVEDAEVEEDASVDEFNTEEDAFTTDDSFGDDGFGDSGFDDDGGGFGDDGDDSTQVFKSFANYSLKIVGENAPFDRYKIEGSETFLGRDSDKCQIVLDDAEVSGVHAVIKKTLISCTLEDLNSSNGTMKDGERINKCDLLSGDKFTIGSTLFEVFISSELIESEQDILMPVEANQEIEIEEVVEEEVDFEEMGSEGGEFGLAEPEEKSLIKKIMKDPKKRMIAIVVLGGLLMLWLMDDAPVKKPAAKAKPKDAKTKAGDTKAVVKKQFSPETLEKLEQNYALALSKYEAAEYYEAKEYLEIIKSIDPEYKDIQTLLKLVKQGYEELLRLKKEEEAEKERIARQLKVNQLLEKAKKSVKAREIAVSESLFGQIMELDPENIDVPQLRLELDAYKKAEQDKKIEAERIRAKRQAMVDALAPGKSLYLKEEWFRAIDKLEKFTKKTGMDEDLIKEATQMMKDSQRKLSGIINPLRGKARSFKEGQDLKRAYETYGQILKHDPSHEESLNERDGILLTLTGRSRRLYREALISESLSLFDEAKEKFQQVQQISPVNSEYYNKATKKLIDYME